MTLVSWLDYPIQSRVLGHAILHEMSGYTPVLRWGVEDKFAVSALVKRCKRDRE